MAKKGWGLSAGVVRLGLAVLLSSSDTAIGQEVEFLTSSDRFEAYARVQDVWDPGYNMCIQWHEDRGYSDDGPPATIDFTLTGRPDSKATATGNQSTTVAGSGDTVLTVRSRSDARATFHWDGFPNTACGYPRFMSAVWSNHLAWIRVPATGARFHLSGSLNGSHAQGEGVGDGRGYGGADGTAATVSFAKFNSNEFVAAAFMDSRDGRIYTPFSFEGDLEPASDYDLRIQAGAAVEAEGWSTPETDQVTVSWEYELELEPVAAGGFCGRVFDGYAPDDGHENALPHTRVEFLPGGNENQKLILGASALGRFCVPQTVMEEITTRDSVIRVVLEHFHGDDSLFATHYLDPPADPLQDRPVDAVFPIDLRTLLRLAKENRELELYLTNTPGQFGNASYGPASTNASIALLSDVANIHYRSTQYVEFLRRQLAAPDFVTKFSGLTIRTFTNDTCAEPPCSTRYNRASRTVFIEAKDDDSRFKDRRDAFSEGPEGLEWHEITHHLADVYGIADDAGNGTCRGDNHEGWDNPSTCDSLNEGFAYLLPALARQAIDGVADVDYAGFGSLETKTWKAWSRTPSGRSGTEDMAVGGVLLDLVDTAADSVPRRAWRDPSSIFDVTYLDEVSLDVRTLWEIMKDDEGVDTIRDLYGRVTTSSLVPEALRTLRLDLDRNGTADIEKIATPFLMRGFHFGDPRLDVAFQTNFQIGTFVARTDHVVKTGGEPDTDGNGLVDRFKFPSTPGSEILIRNRRAGSVAVKVVVEYPDTASIYEDPVPSGDTHFRLELPPYFDRPLDDGEPLPPCGEADALTVVTITSPNAPPKTFDSCEYYHAIVASGGTTPAIVYEAAGQPIDVEPGRDPNTVPASQGTVTVALLTAPDLKPGDVDPESLRFGVTGAEDSLVRLADVLPDCRPVMVEPVSDIELLGSDVNGDGSADLVCRFDLARTGAGPGGREVFLTGKTRSGTEFGGSDVLIVQ